MPCWALPGNTLSMWELRGCSELRSGGGAYGLRNLPTGGHDALLARGAVLPMHCNGSSLLCLPQHPRVKLEGGTAMSANGCRTLRGEPKGCGNRLPTAGSPVHGGSGDPLGHWRLSSHPRGL